MSKRFGKYASMGVSHREGDDAGHGGKQKNRKNNYRRQGGGGNFIGQRQDGNGEDLRPQLAQQRLNDAREAELGWPLFTEGEPRLGWLLNFTTTSYEDEDSGNVRSAVDCYFVCQDGTMFKARVPHLPYFYLQVKEGQGRDVEGWLRRKFEGRLQEVVLVAKEDLDLPNHLSGLQRQLLKLSFWNVQALMEVRKELAPIIAANRGRSAVNDALSLLQQQQQQQLMLAEAGPGAAPAGPSARDVMDSIVDMREYDVPYHVRFAIDTDVRAGHWFTVTAVNGVTALTRRADLLTRAEPVICAWDIETTKLPLQFPNAEYDQVFMISYMLDRQGYLLCNREVVGGDVGDFEFSPKPEYEGPFKVVNLANEKELLTYWFDHMRQVNPAVYVTYNGDFFDFPFVATRAAKHGLDVEERLGFSLKSGGTEWLSRAAVHMDCLHWVNRDSYLPQGSRGLKAVCKAKLGYDPVEVAPEDMVRMAQESPQAMASYSVSDAVATYYLYMTYIHPFIFSLATIIPMPPDEVLRKGSGTLCEQLLMVEAFRANIICPNKHTSVKEPMYKGHLLDSETYIGGKVEAIESGVFRADLPTKFKCQAAAYQQLIDHLDRDLGYAITHDAGWALEEVGDYEEVKDAIRAQLEALRDTPHRLEVPLIYHLDVAAMYPNIILTNRLQPPAIVTEQDCAACDFNKPGKTCLRQMEWVWRGEHFSCSRAEVQQIKKQLQTDPLTVPGSTETKYWKDLTGEEQTKALKDRLKKYCQKVYKRVLDKPVQERRLAGVCQRENSFYVDTVRAFRDRRYEYKGLNKKWKGKLDAARSSGNALAAAEAADMVVLYDSLQLAHKCILNSFYGYVMRKGARWYSMEMAGVVTNTGAGIIQDACRLVEQLGKPLELDTDGIWCCLPGSFPENFKFKNAKTGKDFRISYPCVMLNVMVAERNTNDQYQTLVDPVAHTYETSREMSIEFEVDGPYKAMILPASKEEGKLIKKRYAVFNFDGSLAELKGFEIKRRGELKLIKVFQGEVFEQFLAGGSLEECYGAVGAVANRWLDMLDTQGMDLTDPELLDYISESTTMSKAMDEYEGRKSCAITTAKRLAQFLGDERIKDKGLSCQYIIARCPEGQPTSERAVPVSIFSAEPAVARSWLRAWCGDVGSAGVGVVPDVRDILDWAYYKDRLGSAIQKIITIPAAMQHVANPVPRIKHPDWLTKLVRARDDKCQQLTLKSMFAGKAQQQQQQRAAAAAPGVADLEDFGAGGGGCKGKAAAAGGQQLGRARWIAAAGGEKAPGEGGEGQDADVAPQSDQQQQQPPEPPEPKPDWQQDYVGWLRAQKRKWASEREDRKRQKVAAARRQARRPVGAGDAGDDHGDEDGDLAAPGAAAGNLGAYLRQQAKAVSRSTWQVLQVAPTRAAGEYRLWVVADGGLYAVPLRVPRRLVVNSSLPAGSPGVEVLGEPTKALLPAADVPLNLYELSLPERDFLGSLNPLSIQLLQAGARGVYQDQVPLDLSAALDLGCCVRVAPAARQRPWSAGYDLRELQVMPSGNATYLAGDGPEGLGPLRHAALYTSHDAPQHRCTNVLLLPALNRCIVQVVATNALGAKEVTSVALDRAWQELLPHLGDAASLGDLSTLNFTVEYYRERLAAARSLQQHLAGLREKQHGPLMLVVQAPGGYRRLQGDIPLLRDIPCANMPVALDDARYPVLQWQLRAARRGLQAVAVARPWLQERVALARYTGLPLAQLEGDAFLGAASALFARSLKDMGHVLWWRDSSLPGIGIQPLPQEEYFIVEELPAGSLSCPGAYRTVCVQLELHHLAVAALDQAAAMAEMEGAEGLEALGAGAPAFKALRALVQGWLADATQGQHPVADVLLQQAYRWISNPAGPLYDGALHKAVAGLMQRLFLGLVVEMQRLGAQLVAADFHSITINTRKRNLSAAVSYTQYLLTTIGRQELFRWLQLTPRTWWHVLHYADKFNWGGVEAPLPQGLWQRTWSQQQAPQQQQQGAGGDGEGGDWLTQELRQELDLVDTTQIGSPGGPQLKAQWNLLQFLPPEVADTAQLVLAEFMYRPWVAAATAAKAGATQGGSQAAADARDALQVQLDYLREQLSGTWGESLLNKVESIAANIPEGSTAPGARFPHRAGSHLTPAELGSPALALVRTLCHLLGLDGEVAGEVLLLRRRMLRLLGVGEFTPEAVFQDPCMSFKLEEVMCSHCNHGADMDLCRDPALSSGDWHCAVCDQPHDKGRIEARLVAALQGRLKEYALQDLACARCKQISSQRLRSQCTHCGGALVNTISAELAVKRLTVFHNLAVHYGFGLLQQLADMALHDGMLTDQEEPQEG